ncbi:unnamed protein product [Calicophoron daubneyi]
MTVERDENDATVIIRDPLHSDKEMERFPVQCMRSPRFRMISSDTNLYNNLFIFTVLARSLPDGSPEAHEHHVFQVLSCPAKEVVDTLRSLVPSNPRRLTKHRSTRMPRRDVRERRKRVQSAPPLRNTNPSIGLRKSDGNKEIFSMSSVIFPGDVPRVHMSMIQTTQEVPMELNSDWIWAEVNLLNYCFDDLEQLTHIIKEKKEELELLNGDDYDFLHRGYSRLKNKRSIAKVSLINESRLNPEFRSLAIEFFQKMKFSIILLSRLVNYMEEPKCPELLHQIFNLLSECVSYWRHSNSRISQLPRLIPQPAFPLYTIMFLHDNLSAEQLQLIQELGAAWVNSREAIEDLPVFIPRFRNGFKVIPEDYDPSLFQYKTLHCNLDPQQRFMQRSVLPEFAQVVLQSGMRVAKAFDRYEAQGLEEINVNEGEYFEVIDDTGPWYRVRNAEGLEGTCPANILTLVEMQTK